MQNVELLVIDDHDINGLIVCLKPHVPMVLTPTLAHEIRHLQNSIAERYYKNPWEDPFYIIWYLHAGKIPWKGLDFTFVHNALINHQEKVIESYLNDIFNLLYINYISFGFPIINCSIITRPLRGISQDFFYLNHINFIKTKKNHANPPAHKRYNKLHVQQIGKKLYLPDDLHARNTFYGFNSINYSEMKEIIDSIQHVPFDENNQQILKETFNEIKSNTLAEIYELASRNMKLLERLSRIQTVEHKIYQSDN